MQRHSGYRRGHSYDFECTLTEAQGKPITRSFTERAVSFLTSCVSTPISVRPLHSAYLWRLHGHCPGRGVVLGFARRTAAKDAAGADVEPEHANHLHHVIGIQASIDRLECARFSTLSIVDT